MSNPVLRYVGDGVRRLAPYQPGRPISEVAQEKGIPDIVKLASNENPLGCSPNALATLHEAKAEQLRLYPDANSGKLRQHLAQQLGVNTNNLLMGNGSNELLELAAQLLLCENTAAVFSQHAFIVYPLATTARRADSTVIPARDFAHNLTAMAAATADERVRIVFVANPNNPTGTYHPPEVIREFLQQVRDDVLVVLDEAYCEYLPDHHNATLQFLRDFPNLLITRTFSKIHGLAGLRIGYGIGDAALIEMLNRIRQPFNTNAIAQAAALAAANDSEHIARTRRINQAGYADITAALQRLSVPFIPSSANFVAFQPPDAAALYDALLNNGIITRQLPEYEMPNHLRITIGREKDNRRFIEVLESQLQKQ